MGKTTVSKIVAEGLGLKVVGGGDVLKEMAIEEGYKPGGEDWWDTDEGNKFLDERKRTHGFDKLVDERLIKKAASGDVVITSYPVPWLSKKGLKVWLSGSVDSRAKRMAKRDHADEERCRGVLAVRDVENHKLYKSIYSIEFGKDLSPFDLVIDTDSIDESKVAEIILHYVRNRRG
ncbi:MAG: cytidylate kinase family protein [Nitrososphaerota archaeon]|nr:cytidylate kinase family protein [Nitrososphaerota archaeon]